jgi:orotidine-5'-phosphate decarboxylase
MNRTQLSDTLFKKRSFLCVGLDTDYDRLPKHLLDFEDPVFEFNKQIIDATHHYSIAYKINTAFYESRGTKGWESMDKTLRYIPKNILAIADAKRGDIGNTAKQYAKTFFETFPFDAVTLSPYMGADSITPFLEYDGKWAILLGLTSNKGAEDFELLNMSSGDKLYTEVIRKCASWGSAENMMFVAGATRAEQLSEIREIIPDHFLLVPGVGAQGGDLQATVQAGMNANGGLLINSSRDIIFAGPGENFAELAGEKAKAVQEQMKELLVTQMH